MSQPSNSHPKQQSNLVHQPFPDHEINLFNPPKKNPNGYLTPAKLYLDGVIEEQLALPGKKRHNWQKAVLNPWTISSISIVLLANLVSGIVILLHHQNVDQTAKVKSAEKLSTGPNLAAQEFVDLNLSSLSTISASSSEEIEENKPEIEQSIIAAYPDYIPTYAAHPSLTKNNNYFYILTEYGGDRSLELAKEQVKHVSLINLPQGMFIYLGAFEQRDKAAEFIEYLQGKSIYAYVYPFD